tara:strand:+ start:3538 stop:4044 length:507 start_codon:yes stop_codon:yes gene_type:complete
MNNINLYKEFYFREIDRKINLNNSFNLPILIISVIISIHFYLFKQDLSICILTVGKILSSLTFLSIILSLYFLLKSFSNLFRTHIYREIADSEKILDYEKSLLNNEKKEKKAETLFIKFLTTEFAECAKHNFEINKTRTEDLANTKQILFIAIILTILYSLIYILSII